MPTALNLTQDQIARYRASIHKRYQREKADIKRRREQAWEAANQAAMAHIRDTLENVPDQRIKSAVSDNIAGKCIQSGGESDKHIAV